MALIDCPECGKEVSDKARECLSCGHPISGACPKCKTRNLVTAHGCGNIVCLQCGYMVLSVKFCKDKEHGKL